MSEPNGPKRRGRGRRSAGPAVPEQAPFRQRQLRYSPTEVISADELESIHLASLEVLEQTGMDFLRPESKELLAEAGAEVDPKSNRVRFAPQLIESLISTAPDEFTVHSWHPDRHLRIGGNWITTGAVGSPPNVSGNGSRRRPGTRHDYRELLKLSQMLNVVQFNTGYPVEPMDLHHSIRHLEATKDMLTLTDRVNFAYSLGYQRNRDCLEMTRIARGVSSEQLEQEPSMCSVINTNSPLQLDHNMLEGIDEFSSRNQVIVITPFTLAGAMAPVTLAGALVQQNAEALAGVAMTQVTRPGAPVIYGGFTSNVDMQSGSPAFGTPEYMKTAMVGGQLARRYGIPYRSSNVNAANALDAQSAYESVFAIWGAIMGGVNMMLHGAGWMEGGLQASFPKMVLDAELLGMVYEFLEPMLVDDETLAVGAIDEVGPGGHFFGVGHTQERFRTAFHHPMLSDWRNYEAWEEAGSPELPSKADSVVSQLLEAYEPPGLDDARIEELDEFVARRVAEGGVATDY